ncbi:MAG: MBOAT family protein [Clostridia bacterium]|nr:MBOAT family protein [Clostridia bacterium]
MTFNSWEFLIFYPLVLLLYFLLPKKAKWPMLLVASYFFYAFYQPALLLLIVLTTLISWLASRQMEKTENKTARKLWLALTLIVCLGVLFFYKYFDFLSLSAYSLVRLFGGEVPLVTLHLILPVGVSFYTFQTLSYVIDIYRGDIESEKNFFFYALFVSFFPQLVAGPIERPSNLIPQLKDPHPWQKNDFIKGAKHMLVGFFKKIVVADTISVYVDAVYHNPEGATGLGVLLATMLFAVQIYCDFSGYTDIAIGCARIMGIRLMKNFDHPYHAQSIKEFWSRWHISLSTWFRDYLYIPLGGNRKGKARRYLNLFIVFLVSGLWHGANWTFVLWGALHGIYQITGHLTISFRNRLLEKTGVAKHRTLVRVIRTLITFLLVDFAWLFFRARTVTEAFTLIKQLFTSWHTPLAEVFQGMGITLVGALTVLIGILTLVVIDHLLHYEDTEDGSDALVKNGAFIFVIWVILLLWVLLLSKGLSSTFIYFQF